MIHVVAAQRRAKENPNEAFGQAVGNFETYAQALATIGKLIDEGKSDETICFYLHDSGDIAWTMVAALH